MSRITFENYAKRAALPISHTEIAGRNPIQQAAERRIIGDVIRKLAISADDDLIEIGCGTGNLLIPLSFHCRSVTGVDHPAVLDGLIRRMPDRRPGTVAGNFLDLEIDQTYDKVLVYSVLHCLANQDEIIRFINKATALLKPNGRLLLGDLPNADRKARFLSHPAGQTFADRWQVESEAAIRDHADVYRGLAADPETAHVDDRLITDLLLHLRGRGFEAYLYPQPPDLPFGHTREDIVAMGPPV